MIDIKGLVYHGPKILKWEDVNDVEPKADEVKIRVKAVGICGSDVHGYLGLTGRRISPMIMGHEFSGIIVDVGKDVREFREGDRVAPYPVDFCGECEMCREGSFHLCCNKKQFGVLNVNGAFAEYICIPGKLCFKLEDDVSFSVGSLVEPLSVAYRAVNRAADLTGKTVLIVGAGTIGLLVLACAKMKNLARIIVSDISDSRLEKALSMGANTVINPKNKNFKEVIDSVTDGSGVDVALEAVGASPTVQQAMSALHFGGTAIWIGNSSKMIEINMQEVVTRELRVYGSFLYSFDEFAHVVDLLNRKELSVSALISLEAVMNEGPELFKRLADDPGSLIKVVLTDRG